MKSVKKLVVLVANEDVRQRLGSDFITLPLRVAMPETTVVGTNSYSDALELLDEVSIAILMVHRRFSNPDDLEAKRFETLVTAISERKIPWIAMTALQETFSFVNSCRTATALASERDFEIPRLKKILERVIDEYLAQ